MHPSVRNSFITLCAAAAVTACSPNEPMGTDALPDSRITAARTVTLPNTPVTSTVQDASNYQIRSDGLGPYVNSTTLVSSIDGSLGDWTLDSYAPRGGTRQIYLDFSRPIAGSGANGGAPASIPSGSYRFHMISKCHLVGLHFLTIAVGTTVRCPLHIGKIYVNGGEYGVTMNAGVTSSGETWPETNYADITCNSSANSRCTSWTVAPNGIGPDGVPANVGVLIQYVTSTTKGKPTTTPVKLGDFYLSFRIALSNP